MTDNTTTRDYSLDAARGVLMSLGILLHAANIYAFGGNWLVSDTEKSFGIGLLAGLIHEFRMPTFFWISGYFAALTFERAGVKGLLQRRIPRLAVPLIASWLTLNLIQKIAIGSLMGLSAAQSLGSGIPIYHLWFLIDLLLFIVMASVFFPWLVSFKNTGRWLAQTPIAPMLLGLATLNLAFSFAARATSFAYHDLWGVTSLSRLAQYAPFFAAGAFMHTQKNARATLMRTPLWLAALALPLALYARQSSNTSNFWINELLRFAELLLVWICVAGVLRLFHDFVRADSATTRFLSDSAYTVFLFHHLLVFALGVVMVHYTIGPWSEFFMISVVTYVLCCAIHIFIIRRYQIARLLFNGK